MATFLIEILVAFPVLLLWLVVVALFVRVFGVRMSPWPFAREHRNALRSFNFLQSLAIFGVLYYGCGMVIVTTLFRYLDWKYFHGSANRLTEGELLENALQWIFGGVLFGLAFFFLGSQPRPKS